jgi:hypothetical protein
METTIARPPLSHRAQIPGGRDGRPVHLVTRLHVSMFRARMEDLHGHAPCLLREDHKPRDRAGPIALAWERRLDDGLFRGLQLSIGAVDAESGDRVSRARSDGHGQSDGQKSDLNCAAQRAAWT